MPYEEIREAHAAVVRTIAELKALRIEVPISLYRAVHALSYALAEPDECRVLPFKRGEPRD